MGEAAVKELNHWQLMRLPENTTGMSVFGQGPSRVSQLELVKWELPEPDGDEPKRPGRIGIGQLSVVREFRAANAASAASGS